MRASEILQGLGQLLSRIEQDQATEPAQPQRAELTPVEVDHTDGSESKIFVPPLQAKLEILKKSVGMDNVYGQEGEQDELHRIKQMAGLSPTQQEAADDEPLDQ